MTRTSIYAALAAITLCLGGCSSSTLGEVRMYAIAPIPTGAGVASLKTNVYVGLGRTGFKLLRGIDKQSGTPITILDNIRIQIGHVFLKYLDEANFGGANPGEIIGVAEVHFANDPDNVYRRVFFQSEEQSRNASLNTIDPIVFGPAQFNGSDLSITIHLVELDKEENELAKTIIDVASTAAQGAAPEYGPAIGLAASFAKLLVSLNEDDPEFRFTLSLAPVRKSGEKSPTLQLREGSFVLIKHEHSDRSEYAIQDFFDWDIYDRHIPVEASRLLYRDRQLWKPVKQEDYEDHYDGEKHVLGNRSPKVKIGKQNYRLIPFRDNSYVTLHITTSDYAITQETLRTYSQSATETLSKLGQGKSTTPQAFEEFVKNATQMVQLNRILNESQDYPRGSILRLKKLIVARNALRDVSDTAKKAANRPLVEHLNKLLRSAVDGSHDVNKFNENSSFSFDSKTGLYSRNK